MFNAGRRKLSVKYQYLATLRINILSLGVGTIIGWFSPFIPVLLSSESPLITGPITVDQASWIRSLFCFGGVFGTVICCFLNERFGTQICGFIIALLEIVFYLIVIFGTNVYELFVGVFLVGFGISCFIVIPVYVGEMADDRIRGKLGSILIFAINLGTLISFIAGTYLSYHIMACVMLIFPILFFVSFMFLPYTPQSLAEYNDQTEEALNGLGNLITDKSCDKIDNMNKYKNDRSDKIKLSELVIPTTRKAMFIGIILITFNQLSGCYSSIVNAATIFTDAGVTFSPNKCAIIIGVIQLLGSCASVSFIERFGRKYLYQVSSLGTAIGLAVLATYDYLRHIGFNIESLNLLPVISLSFIIFIATVGMLPLPFVVLSELLPQRERGIITSICIAWFGFSSFSIVKLFGILTEILGLYTIYYMFSVCCLFSFFFYTIYLPETKGKSIDEIIELLK